MKPLGDVISRRALPILAWTLFCLVANSFTGCEGGSTGVDNPGLSSLPVEFEGPDGASLAVKGTLEVYARTHNPAVDSQPLLRVQIEKASEVELLAEDFARIGTPSVRDVRALSKRAVIARFSRSSTAVESDGLIHFNLYFKSDLKSGATKTGFTFDPLKRVFGREGGTSLPSVALSPEALVRFASAFHADQVNASLGRIILPGTPFQGTLVDSEFALDDVPPGQFNAHFVAGDGKVFALLETLNTQAAPMTFTADPNPIGQITADVAPLGFGVSLGAIQSVVATDTVPIEGQLLYAHADDSRIAFVWRVLLEQSTGPAHILNPAQLATRIVFPAVGNYRVELSATLGLTTKRDTMDFKVNAPLVMEQAKFSSPISEEKIPQGSSYKVIWESKTTGLMRLEWLPKDGVTQEWHAIADSIKVEQGTGTWIWATPMLDSLAVPGLMRLRRIASDSVIAQVPGLFYLTR